MEGWTYGGRTYEALRNYLQLRTEDFFLSLSQLKVVLYRGVSPKGLWGCIVVSGTRTLATDPSGGVGSPWIGLVTT